MALGLSLFPSAPLHPCLQQRCSLSLRNNLSVILRAPVATVKTPITVHAFSSPGSSAPATEEELLEAIAESDGSSLPGVRVYENDLARLALVGAVGFEQALTAAAADGGETASEHIAAGMAAMVVETVFPGPPDEHSTTLTRLFLPARKVKEKAKKLRRSPSKDIFSDTPSQTILAMTFRQVILSQLWNFELVLLRPGTERNVEELAKPREVPASFVLSSSDDQVISAIAEVICIAALESTERRFLDNSLGGALSSFFHWLRKPKQIASKDSSVVLYKLFEDEIIASAESLLVNFNSEKANYKPFKATSKNSWWSLSTFSKMEKIGGPEFGMWINKYVPAYRLQIDSDRFPGVKFEGWKQMGGNRWEVFLTHSQMVELADILDMYYEDSYTLPDKQLSFGMIAKSTNLPTYKRIASMLKLFSATIASGLLLVVISILGQFHLPHLHNLKKYSIENGLPLQSSNTDAVPHQSIGATKLGELCVSIVNKIKDAFGWTGDIQTEESNGAWIGELPVYLQYSDESGYNSGEVSSSSALSKDNDEKLKASAQDVACYQVVMSADGRIIGFQPMSRVAVNQWAANPLAKELYGGRELSPGFIEPSLKISRPTEVGVIQLFMSTNPDSSFALARPLRWS